MSTNRYYKAVRPDGGSFHNRSFKWATEPGGVTTHPDFRRQVGATYYLSVSTSPTDCTGFAWPARLLVVEPVGEVFTPHPIDLPNKRAAGAFRTVEERPAWELFGPNGEAVVALIEAAGRVTPQQATDLRAARDAARDVAWYAARYVARDVARGATWDAARDATWDAARDATWYAARYAVEGLCLRDLIGTGDWTQEAYDVLTRPWRTVMGPIHPDDEPLDGAS